MKTRRRRPASLVVPDLFSALETTKQKAERIARTGNYATRTIRRWIRSDPAAVCACRDISDDVCRLTVPEKLSRVQRDRHRVDELAILLKNWFQRIVGEEEPSASYAEYLCGSIDVEWDILAAEVLGNDWAEGS